LQQGRHAPFIDAYSLIIRLSSTSQSASNHSIIAIIAGYVTVANAKAANAGNMS